MAEIGIRPVYLDGFPRTMVFKNAGAPSSGVTGSFANFADPGDLLVDTTNLNFYQNTGTLLSPTWTALGNGALPLVKYSANAATTNYQALGSDIAGADKVYLSMTTIGSSGATLTLPTAANTYAALVAAGIVPQPGYSWELEVQNAQNTNADAWTITTSTGWTLTQTTATIAKMVQARYLLTMTTAAAFTLQALGQTAISVIP